MWHMCFFVRPGKRWSSLAWSQLVVVVLQYLQCFVSRMPSCWTSITHMAVLHICWYMTAVFIFTFTWFSSIHTLVKSSKYLLSRCLDPQIPPEKTFRGSQHLLTRYLEDVGRLGILQTWIFWGVKFSFAFCHGKSLMNQTLGCICFLFSDHLKQIEVRVQRWLRTMMFNIP